MVKGSGNKGKVVPPPRVVPPPMVVPPLFQLRPRVKSRPRAKSSAVFRQFVADVEMARAVAETVKVPDDMPTIETTVNIADATPAIDITPNSADATTTFETTTNIADAKTTFETTLQNTDSENAQAMIDILIDPDRSVLDLLRELPIMPTDGLFKFLCGVDVDEL